jgi:uncharacterized membrane protein YqgA involved in biofilm formation
VTGTIINAAAIVAGGALGRVAARWLTPQRQTLIKFILGALTVYVGLSTTIKALAAPSFGQFAKEFGIMLLALMVGNALGRLLRLQRGLNHLGRYARERFTDAQKPGDAHKFSEGFVTCTLLFCVGPMAILGSVQDGLTGDFKLLAIKAVMDGLATVGFVAAFGWGATLAVVPVFVYQGTLTLLARWAAPYLENQALLDSINATGGMMIFSIALVVMELKRVELANYLPALAIAPLLTWWWK